MSDPDPSILSRDELCRRGKLLCSDCNKPMQMYYIPQCFHCTKPQGRPVTVVELIPALHYIENQGHEGFHRKFLDRLEDLSTSQISNDVHIRLLAVPDFERSHVDSTVLELLDTVKQYYPEDNILWWLSW